MALPTRLLQRSEIVRNDVVNIVFCCDDKFSGQLQVAALSAVLNAFSSVAIYVIDCGISGKGKDALFSLKTKYVNVIDIVFREPTREKIFEKFPIPAHFSSAIFYRLAIPKTFPELKRAIYMDCDVFVSDDISLLWSVDLGDRAFGALNEETNFFSSGDIARRKAKIGLPPERVYMNSGVLLIDIKRFEREKIFERVLEFVSGRSEPLPCPEQDAMNLCLSPDEYVPLDPKFNFTPFAPRARRCLRKMRKPVIIHYSCNKPWSFNKNLVNKLYEFWLFRYGLWFIKEYWMYSDQIDGHAFSSNSTKQTWNFLYKQVFGKFEYFIAKKVRNGIIRLWQRVFKRNRVHA
ncbi:MAG: glycosyltransferase family 8 protein [Puniceicoccales bacterium]|jgi:lipopolysaccharide biosynthesis glycosyltransferase|nr:glycosyltransferase family 8 protein [Puniceicoccales bacterium]